MVALNQILADGANAAVRFAVRQAVESATGLAPASTAAPTSASSPTPSDASAIPSSIPSSTALGSPSPTPSSNPGDNSNGNNSPLLFFVALGFGVVFTNLWIIVGVKYCFRYNARNRQLRGLDENGEPISMDSMPQRPHRRRREKKLMTMDEVNEKFPMTKYKTWVSGRAREGLPTAGGVSVSRANSIRSVQGIIPESPSKDRHSIEGRPQTAATAAKTDDKAAAEASNTSEKKTDIPQDTSASGDVAHHNALTSTRTIASVDPKDHDRNASDDEDDDEHINAALPPELLEAPGDTCAICIDTLEDDDDVRGLTCGHAFHAVCLDPWLTNRRACCPLCKADYYTPKPRPPPPEGEAVNVTTVTADPARNNGRMNMPRNPTRTLNPWSRRNATRTNGTNNSGRSSRTTRSGASQNVGSDPNYGNGHFQRFDRQSGRQPEAAPQGSEGNQEGFMSRFGRRARFNVPFLSGNRNEPTSATPEVTASGANGGALTTPSQLEAGIRPTPATGAN